jgi:hypothetical protein
MMNVMMTLAAFSSLAMAIQGCGVRPCSPDQLRERTRVDVDERVDDWRVNGETIAQRFIHAERGCYLVEVKYRQDYTRVRGASSLWGISPLAAAIDTASNVQSSSYETGYFPFALQLRNQHTYQITATFDGDQFWPRIVELNSAAERTREILPARSPQELEICKTGRPGAGDIAKVVCAGERQGSALGK